MTHPIEVQGGRGLEEKPQRNLASQVARSQPAHKHCCLGTKSAPPDSAKCPGTFSSQGYVEGCFSCCSSEAGGPARSRGHGTGPAAKQGPVGEGRAEQDRSGDHGYASSPACPPRPPGRASPDTWCISHISARAAQLSQAPQAGGRLEQLLPRVPGRLSEAFPKRTYFLINITAQFPLLASPVSVPLSSCFFSRTQSLWG